MTYPPPPGTPDPYGQQPPGQDPYGQSQPPQDPFATPATNPYAQQPPTSPPSSVPPTSPPPGTPPYGQPYAQPYGQPYGYTPTPPQNSMALTAMILSLVGIAVAITAPVGAILGHIALKQIRQSGESGEGMAKTGIIVGWIITGLYALCCLGYFGIVIAAIGSAGIS